MVRLLPLFRLLPGVLLPLILLGVLAESVLDGDRFPFEVPLLLSLHAHASPLLDRWALAFTDLGGVAVTAPISGLLLAFLWFRQRPLALFFAVSVGGSALVALLLKLTLGRVRPSLWPRLVSETDASFPSGHALYSLVLALLLFWRATRFRAWCWPALILGLGFSALVGLSRLYLGVHDPSAGWLVALAWVLGVYTVMRPGADRPGGAGEPAGHASLQVQGLQIQSLQVQGGSLGLPGAAQ